MSRNKIVLEIYPGNRVYLKELGNEEIKMNSISRYEQKEIERLTMANPIPTFGPGDTLRVLVTVIEGERKRKQAYEGVCIARKNAGLGSAFTVRKISSGEGVERVFPLYSPLTKIEVVRRGVVRRAKLYYLRDLTGKATRIKEKRDTSFESKKAKKARILEEEKKISKENKVLATESTVPSE